MPCPRCQSHDLWDDNLAWGCNRCDFFTTGGITNTPSKHDTFNGQAQVQYTASQIAEAERRARDAREREWLEDDDPGEVWLLT